MRYTKEEKIALAKDAMVKWLAYKGVTNYKLGDLKVGDCIAYPDSRESVHCRLDYEYKGKTDTKEIHVLTKTLHKHHPTVFIYYF